ncbi:3-oxoadipate enol-lactonase [Rhodovulum sp. DZ06]|uniref:3-oxoadipate enol-lactonase n=1 Tax=Rhodovulum sp. DZ06 TaxID=3425126 RepID=UPI003D34AE6A
MQALRSNGVYIHYADEGDPDGAPVLFANSLGTDFRVWDALIPRLPAGLRIIRFDKRGHGLSEAPEPPYGMQELVHDAAAVLDHLKVKDAVVVGLSIGGLIAQGLAAERPDLVKAMVLMDTAAKIGTEDMWNARIDQVQAQGIASMAEGILERWFARAFREEKPGELAMWRAMLTRTTVEGYAGCCGAIRDCDLMESTSRLTLPTLAMGGDEDGSTPPDLVRETANLVLGARFELIRGAGHLPCVEKPGETAALISAFLEEVGHV